jgi:hypothetical protein
MFFPGSDITCFTFCIHFDIFTDSSSYCYNRVLRRSDLAQPEARGEYLYEGLPEKGLAGAEVVSCSLKA